MLTVLSLFDDRSKPKGSRDPLGIEAIWSFLGRKVVGNLTTITNNLDNFIVALLCCYHGNSRSTDLNAIQQDFMRAEQLADYLRLALNENASFLGITRAKANHKNSFYPLGLSEEAQILSNQLSYGLWGLYSTAMQVAKLIQGSERKLTSTGQDLIQRLLIRLGDDNWNDFVKVASKENASAEDIKRLAKPFNDLLADDEIKQAMVNSLLGWQSVSALQRELFAKAQDYLSSKYTEQINAQQFCAWVVEQHGISDDLKCTLQQIQSIEPLLVLAATLMDWLQGQRNKSRNDLVSELQPALTGIAFKEEWTQVLKLPHKSPFLANLHQCANSADAAGVINVLLEQNKTVMKQRGGASWLEWEGERLKVRVPNDKPILRERLVEFCQTWRNNYFIGSFLYITKAGLK